MSKNVFISVPMSGREREDIISEIHDIGALYFKEFGYDVRFIDNADCDFFPCPAHIGKDAEVKCENIGYLSQALLKMAYCDEIIFADDFDTARGCRVECYVALKYGIPCYFVETTNDGEKVLCKHNEFGEVIKDGILYEEIMFDWDLWR